MKKYIYAVIITCLGVILIGLNTKEHNPPVPESTTSHVQAVQEPIAPVSVPEPIQPVEAVVEPPSAPVEQAPVILPEQKPVLDNDAKAFIYQHESGNCPTKWQGEHGACPAYHGTPDNPNTGYGLCQATPGWKMASAGEDWATSYDTQDRWCTDYANSRYGGWQNAYNVWLSQRWW